MSLWSVSARKIFVIEVDGVELKFDPVRCIINYNKAVKDHGGLEIFRQTWERYHSAGPGPEATNEERFERELQDAQDCLYFAEIGAATVGMPLVGAQPHKEGVPELTTIQGRDVVYRYVEYMSKKEPGEETSLSQATPESSPSDETSEAGPGMATS